MHHTAPGRIRTYGGRGGDASSRSHRAAVAGERPAERTKVTPSPSHVRFKGS
jgi:hypothetical protein